MTSLRTFFANAPSLQALHPKQYGEQVGVETDAEIDAFNREHA